MKRIPSALPGVVVIEPVMHGDARGFFMETYRESDLAALGITDRFVQDNQSRSSRGVIRGMHFQVGGHPQAKMIRCARGSILDVTVDLRRGSPTFGQWASVLLSAENRRQIYLPPGFAHGFMALEDSDVLYLMSDHYRSELERGIQWRDPALGLPWPARGGLLSPKDKALPMLNDVTPADLPIQEG